MPSPRACSGTLIGSAALFYADLRDFTALSEATEPAAVIAALDAWFDRIAGAVHVSLSETRSADK